MGSYFNCLGRYASFGGRSSRGEFWGYTIVNAVILAVMTYFYFNTDSTLSQNISATVLILYILITACPSIAVVIRRWHDLGRTGKWILLNFIPGVGTIVSFCFFLTKGEEITNEYGRNPLERKLRRKRK